MFARKRLARLVRTANRLHLFNALHDNVHGFDIHYEIDLDSGRIAAADSVTSRLPYSGICDEPQARITALIGKPVRRELRREIQDIIGGPAGCAQLYDLTADLIKLLDLP